MIPFLPPRSPIVDDVPPFGPDHRELPGWPFTYRFEVSFVLSDRDVSAAELGQARDEIAGLLAAYALKRFGGGIRVGLMPADC
jgi:hypothetical protein